MNTNLNPQMQAILTSTLGIYPLDQSPAIQKAKKEVEQLNQDSISAFDRGIDGMLERVSDGKAGGV